MNLNNPEVRAQMKQTVVEKLAQTLAETKELGLRHGRLMLETPFEKTSIEFMMWLDALYEAGCSVVSHTEHALHSRVVGGPPSLQVHIIFRLPIEQVLAS
jgi:hypothetical protein